MASPRSSRKEIVAELLAQAKKDYGTPAERRERAGRARLGLGQARTNGAAAAGTPRGRR